MILYYSGAAQHKQPQPYASKSLGGYMSSSPVPNGQTGAIFGTLTRDSQWQNDCKMIVLYNTSGQEVLDLRIYIESDSKYIDYKIAAVASAHDSQGCPIFESIPFTNQLPSATLEYHDVDSPIVVDEFGNQKVIGLWIQRSLKELPPEEVDYVYKLLSNQPISCEDAESYGTLDSNTLSEILDNMTLHIDYENSTDATVELLVEGDTIKIGAIARPLDSISYRTVGEDKVQIQTLEKEPLTEIIPYNQFIIEGAPATSLPALLNWIDENFFA